MSRFAYTRHLKYLDLDFCLETAAPPANVFAGGIQTIASRSRDSETIASHYFRRWVQTSWAHGKVASYLFSSVPSLEYIVLNTCPGDANHWWKVNRKDKQFMFAPMGEDEGKKLEAAQGMARICEYKSGCAVKQILTLYIAALGKPPA